MSAKSKNRDLYIYLVRLMCKPSIVVGKGKRPSSRKNVTLVEQHSHFQLHLIADPVIMITASSSVVLKTASETTSPVVMVTAPPVVVRFVVMVMGPSVVSVGTAAISVAIVTTTVVTTVVRHASSGKQISYQLILMKRKHKICEILGDNKTKFDQSLIPRRRR